eukprot:7382832-Prymnesium_polylepis.1
MCIRDRRTAVAAARHPDGPVEKGDVVRGLRRARLLVGHEHLAQAGRPAQQLIEREGDAPEVDVDPVARVVPHARRVQAALGRRAHVAHDACAEARDPVTVEDGALVLEASGRQIDRLVRRPELEAAREARRERRDLAAVRVEEPPRAVEIQVTDVVPPSRVELEPRCLSLDLSDQLFRQRRVRRGRAGGHGRDEGQQPRRRGGLERFGLSRACGER